MDATENKKQRLIYIDVIRGLCIFVVIYTHVIGFGMADAYPKTIIHEFLTSFFLIMFFFMPPLLLGCLLYVIFHEIRKQKKEEETLGDSPDEK